MAVGLDYLTYEDVVEDQREDAEIYHNTQLKIIVMEKMINLIFLFGLILLRVPNLLRDNSPFGIDYSILNVFYIYIIISVMTFLFYELPLEIYGEKIERRFGFSTRDNKSWIVDKLKEIGIGLVIALIIIEFLYIGLSEAPNIWWIYAVIGYFIFSTVLSTLSPYLISVFTKIEPLEEGSVRNKVTNLAKEMNLNFEEIYKWNMSQQTTKVNAAVTGFGKTLRIMLGDTLLQKFREDEIEIVMAHEIAHQKNKDVYRSILFNGLIAFLGFYFVDLGFDYFIEWFDYYGKDDPATYVYLLFSLSLVLEILGKLSLWHSRRREKAADLVSIDKIRNIEIFESAFARLAKENLSYPNPSKLKIMMMYSHPPINERIRYGKEYIQKLS